MSYDKGDGTGTLGVFIDTTGKAIARTEKAIGDAQIAAIATEWDT